MHGEPRPVLLGISSTDDVLTISFISQASVVRHHGAENHHRFVFHRDEVTSSERQYYPGELGITGSRLIPPPFSTTSLPPFPFPGVAPSRPDNDAKDGGGQRQPELRCSLTGVSDAPVTESLNLRAGDVLYWHNLASGGERMQPVDPKSRRRLVRQRLGR